MPRSLQTTLERYAYVTPDMQAEAVDETVDHIDPATLTVDEIVRLFETAVKAEGLATGQPTERTERSCVVEVVAEDVRERLPRKIQRFEAGCETLQTRVVAVKPGQK